ncbi:hypothetical protein [Deinococcus sonorensis]|uniref:Lipoprotein n=2 Tax=Deinococcus sonorensis TaxID=309891 RepID=A0AAU7UEI0_9DEIO
MINPFSVRQLPLLGGAALLASLLTACPGPPTPPPPGVSLGFSYPAQADTSGLTLAAIYFTGTAGTDLKVLSTSSGYGGYGPPAGSSASLYMDGYALAALAKDPLCMTPFKDGEAKGMQDVTLSNPEVRTCNVYFLAFRDANGDRLPQKAEEAYMTHDILSNASTDFTYSYLSPDGKSRESGSRKSGWTLVRHMVLQPEATPGQYLVSMNSVPTADQGIPVALHEPSNYFSSLSVPVAGGQR